MPTFGQPQDDEKRELKVGDKVRWKQMPAAIAVITQANYSNFSIKFETDGPLKGTTMPLVPRAQLWPVTVLDELAIEGTETPDPFFRKKPAQDNSFEAQARKFIDDERKQKGQ